MECSSAFCPVRPLPVEFVTQSVTQRGELVTQRMSKLTDAQLRAWLKHRPAKRIAIPDRAVSGLTLRLGPSAMTWTLRLRVKGEGGVSQRGHRRNGKLYRVTLGEYP